MDERDTAAILPTDTLSPSDDEATTHESFPPNQEVDVKANGPRRPPFACPFGLSVEPVLFLAMFSIALQAPLSTQYLWDRISEDLGYNGTKAGGCGNTSADPDPLQKEVETLTAHWNLYINMGGFAVGVVTVTLLGSWSDQAGRRPVLIVPSLGLALQAVVYLVVMYQKLPVAYFLLGRLLSGLSGDFNSILAGCFSYVADTSDRRSRTFRVAVLEACLGLAGMFASVIGGQWRRAQGYINPFWLVLATNLAAALYAYLFVRESVTPDPSAKLLTTRHHRAGQWLEVQAVALHAVLLPGGDGALRQPGAVRAVRAECAAVLGPGADRLRLSRPAPGLPEQPAGPEAPADLPGRLLGGGRRAGLQHGGAGGDRLRRQHAAHVYRLWAVFSLHGYNPSAQVQAVQACGPIRTRCSVCLGCLCGGSVFPGGQRPLQLHLPRHAAPPQGLPLPLRCHPPPHPRWNHWEPGVCRPEKRAHRCQGILTRRVKVEQNITRTFTYRLSVDVGTCGFPHLLASVMSSWLYCYSDSSQEADDHGSFLLI